MSRNGLFVEYCAKDFLDGTLQLSAWEELAYRRICDMIYASNNNLLDDDKKLAWMTKTGNRWKGIKLALLDAGKIEVENGLITNHRCTKTLQKSERNIVQKSVAGKSSSAKRKSLKTQETMSTAVLTLVPTAVITAVPTNQESKNSEDKSSSYMRIFEKEFLEVFWPAYPIKQGKKPALKSFVKARSKTPLETIMVGLAKYNRLLELPNAPNPKWAQGWLNDERWNDEINFNRPPKLNGGSHPEHKPKNLVAGSPEWKEMMREQGL